MMNLRNLPLDTQRCTLLIGSFAYDSNETVYEWNKQKAIDIQSDLIMNQFSLIDAYVGQEILIRNNRKCLTRFVIFSMTNVRIVFPRNSLDCLRCVFFSSSRRLFSHSIICPMCPGSIFILGRFVVKS